MAKLRPSNKNKIDPYIFSEFLKEAYIYFLLILTTTFQCISESFLPFFIDIPKGHL